MAATAINSPPLPASRRRRLLAAVTTYRPNYLQRTLAYLANGDCPPLPIFLGYITSAALGSFGLLLILGAGVMS